jgi:peptide deformylase
MIITNNEAALRVKCEDVSPEEIGPLIEVLEKELEHSAKLGRPGIGLAAPQIGIAKKIAIVRLGNNINFNLVNAKLKQGFYSSIFKDEGCLSFPGRVENTIRFQEVVIENNLSIPNSFIATGLLAVVCQHELDHLNSSLFFDKLSAPIHKKNKVGPNDPCICGKIDIVTNKVKKFKKCCGR